MKLKKMFSILMALAMVLSLGAVTVFAEGGSESAAYDLEKVALTKDLNVADGIDISSFNTFTFSFTAEGSDSADKDDHPTIVDQTVTVGSQSGDHAYGSLTLDNVFKIDAFKHAGEYVYTVEEVAGNNSNITYDTGKYTVSVYVINDGDSLKFYGVTVENEDGEKVDPTIPEGNNTSGFNFENTYKENLGGDDSAALTVEKLVTGEYGDKTKTFPVTVTLTLPSTATASDVTVAEGAAWNSNTLTASADLSDGKSIVFTKLPAGTTFTVSETQAATYKSKITGYVVTEDTDYVTGNRTIDGKVITETGKTVTIENNRENIVPTGVIINNLPYLLMVAVAGVGFAYVVLKKKRTND